MRSVDDATSRARIRDAAIRAFGQRGFDGTSLRDVAKAAGVSPALIVHHFGGKDGLREACDAYVVNSFLDEKQQLAGDGAARMMRAALDDIDGSRAWVDYLARMLVDDSPAADALFDTLLDGTMRMLQQQTDAGMLRELEDLRTTAIYLTLYGIGPVVLRRQLARAFGETELTAGLLERSTLPVLDMFTHGIYADDRLLVAAREALRRTTGPRSDKGENDPNQDPDPPVAP